MVRLMGLPTRDTNSSHAASSQGPAQRHTKSLRDRDEYRVGLEVCAIVKLFRIGAVVSRYWP